MPTSPSPTANHSPRPILRPAIAAMTVANSGTVATITAAVPVPTVRIPYASIPLDRPTSIVPTSPALRISVSGGHAGLRRIAKMNSPTPAKKLRSPDISSGGNEPSATCTARYVEPHTI
jgi:hypothetical protein